MSNQLIEIQLKKMRRRIEEFLRHTTPRTLVKVAIFCNIPVPKTLKDLYMKKD